MRIGNAAYEQLQLDVYGELMDALHACHRYGLEHSPVAWNLQKKLLEYLEKIWDRPDRGMWEIRGEPRQFTFSKIMCWVAFDRAIKSVEQYGLDGPCEHWRKIRDRICRDILDKAYDRERNTFVQYYGARDLDASLLLIPQLGFLPPEDPRVRGTIEAIERELVCDGFVLRYPTRPGLDGLPGGEGVFLACSFWLANSLSADRTAQRRDQAVREAAGRPQRSRAAVRGVRSALGTAARQFSAGLLAYRDHQHRRPSLRDRKRLGGARRSRGDRARWRVADSGGHGRGC